MMMIIGLLVKYSLELILQYSIEIIEELVNILISGFSKVDDKNLNQNKYEILV